MIDLSCNASIPVVGPYVAWFLDNFDDLQSLATHVIALASVAAVFTPHPDKSRTALATARKLLDWASLNIKHSAPTGVPFQQEQPK